MKKYDAIIIGAGMSGLAAGIRLAMYGQKVCILEKHRIPGGLNSYYKRGKREFDVGLHALTNFSAKGQKGTPLSKLLKQLRLPYESLKLQEQSFSKITFPDVTLKFNNDLNLLESEIREFFPSKIENFQRLVKIVKDFNDTSLDNEFQKARPILSEVLDEPLLEEMLIAPLLIYGSAWENDMDFSQFVIMFKALYVEGFSRPEGGVRTILNILTERFTELGGELLYKHGVKCILTKNQSVQGVVLESEEILESKLILSSAGLPETYKLVDEQTEVKPDIGRLSFTECIFCTDKKPLEIGFDETIMFYNSQEKYKYQRPDALFDDSSAVICFSNNFSKDDFSEGIIRVTYMANYERWKSFEKSEYREQKELLADNALSLVKRLSTGTDFNVNFKDMFTPTTVTRYTGHFQGTVYGSTDKVRNGLTPFEGLVIIGTDQGFLGIIGSMLSGISMANLHGLMR